VALNLGSLTVVAAVLGALVGSFLNVVIARLPKGENIAWPGSHCPQCGDPIPWYLNVPVLSWLALRGRCRACKARISLRYPVVELLTATLFVACVARFQASWATVVAWVFVSSLVVITFVDIDIWEIPDEISLPGIVVGMVVRPLVFDVPWWSGLVGAVLGAGILWFVRWVYQVLRNAEGMGLGDVKLLGMIGAFVGPGGLLPVVLVSSLFGSLIGILVLVFGPSEEAEDERAEEASAAPTEREATDEEEEEWTPPPNAVPFGPFLALGGIAQLLLGPWLNGIIGAP
jgi:leader peptidase (prepilin peptidase)/N-methyltransferase